MYIVVPDHQINALLDARGYDEALRVLAAYPNNDPDAARKRWLCYAAQDRHQDAIAAVTLVPQKDDCLHIMQAWSHLEREEWEDAAFNAKASMDIVPTAMAAEVLAKALIRNQSTYLCTEEVRSQVSSCLRLALELPDCNEKVFLLLASIERYSGGDLIALLQRALTRFPDSGELRERLACQLNVDTKAEQIIDLLRPVLQDDPSDVAASRAYDAYLRLERIEEAIAQLDRIAAAPHYEPTAIDLLKAETYLGAGMIPAGAKNTE